MTMATRGPPDDDGNDGNNDDADADGDDVDEDGDGDYTTVGITALCEALKVTAELTKCELRDNKLGVEGWTIIFNALRDNPTSKIAEWNLSGEKLGPAIAKPLAEYLSVTAELTKIE